MLYRPSLLLRVGQREGTALLQDVDVVADMADGEVESLGKLIRALSLVSLVKGSEDPAALRLANCRDAVCCAGARYSHSRERAVWTWFLPS